MLDALLPGAQHLQNPHPLVVHFPIAFLTGAALVYCLSWLLGENLWSGRRWLLPLGALSAIVAVATGLYAEAGVMVAPSVRAELLVPHKRFMRGNLGLGSVIAVWAIVARPLPAKGRLLFLFLLLLLVVGITKGADYRGRMIYDYNAGGNACGQPMEFTQ